jgi:protein-tyrosine phosphatase
MIDIHTHLLPAVDDGSPSIEVSVRVLEQFRRDGVTQVVCTPHLEISQAARRPLALHRERLAALQGASDALPELLLGCEIMLDAPGQPIDDRSLGLAGSRALLVEFSRLGVPPRANDELARLTAAGWRPVLAHPERYRGCTVEQVRAWRALGVVIQTDARLLLAKGPAAALANDLLSAGLIDILASDNHGDSRSQKAVTTWLAERGGAAQAELLTVTNPTLLLEDRPLRPVPPLGHIGVLGRLGRLLG